ncbi:HECT domain [Trypanosoma melophagium]|uniref:HECT domain n=1 Tax=Trypanosoma melophagium TaxID=715481 RepID=UPI00351A356F|nr:HECT domain [Trypanosoma melophagium]
MSMQANVLVEDSKQQVKAVHRLKNDPDGVLGPLESMCLSLVMGVERYVRDFDAAAAIPMLVRMTEKEAFVFRGDTLTMLFRAISLIMEHVPSSYDSMLPFHKQLMKSVCQALSRTLAGKMKYNNTDNVMLLEESLRLIRFISRDESDISALKFGMPDIIQIAASENSLLARQAFDVLLILCSKVILPSEAEKPHVLGFPISFLGWKGKKKHAKKDDKPVGSEEPVVVAVERRIAPFLHTSIQQYATSLESFPEAWPFLEMALQCLGMLMQRALLCHRPSTARKMVTPDICKTLFHLILFNDSNVALDHVVRAERLLLCETMLDVAIRADWKVASESLLTEKAQSFYKHMFEESDAEVTTLLNDPFPLASASLRGAQRRDKNHIASIAAVRLFILACPRLPREAFGPKPKVLLPVPEWMWEDEMRHRNCIDEERCISLETNYVRLSKESVIKIQTKSMFVDFHTMKMCGGFGGVYRNVYRKFVPFVFHVVDDENLRLTRSAKEVMASNNIFLQTKHETKTAMTATAAGMPPHLKNLLQHYVLNKEAPVLLGNVKMAELYLESLCNFVVWVPGQMTMQLGTCACASLLHAVIRSGEEKRLVSLIRIVLRPLCEMLRVAIVSSDKATKSICLTMMVWLLCHPLAAEWQFCGIAQRCGLLRELEELSRGGNKGYNHTMNYTNKFTQTPFVHVRSEERQTRTKYLATTALAIHAAITEEMAKLHSPRNVSGLSTVDVKVVRQAVQDLKTSAKMPGVHREVVEHVLYVMELSLRTITAFEISMLGIADAVLTYLLESDNNNNNNTAAADTSINGSASVERGKKSPSLGSFASTSCVDFAPFDGRSVADHLYQRCRKDRLECFLMCAAEKPRGMEALIENLVSALPMHSTFPLVETVLATTGVCCRPPVKAVMACSHISPTVVLCSKGNNTTTTSKRSASGFTTNSGKDTSNRVNLGEDSISTQSHGFVERDIVIPNPRDYCPHGHPLEVIAIPQNTLSPCDLCEEEVRSGFRCRQCEFHICMECHANPDAHYEGASPLLSSRSNPEDDNMSNGMERTQLNQTKKTTARTHLFASIGDIERYFRTGTSIIKNTDVAPAPLSALQNIDYFIAHVQSVLVRRKKQWVPGSLRKSIQEAVKTFFSSGSSSENTTTADKDSEGKSSGKQETQDMNQFIRDAMEERYVLYTSPGGRCAYQETFIGNLLQRALCEGVVGLVEQLENCLLNTEGTMETAVSSDCFQSSEVIFDTHTDSVLQPSRELPSRVDGTQTFVFHHFENDEETRCCCGEKTRQELNTVYSSKIVRKPTRLSQNQDTVLLILLHKFLNPLMKQRVVDINPTTFVSPHFTTLIVKSLAASALRVALLPPRIAVPRWVDFVLTQAKFLLPLNVREHIARFFAYGARRALYAQMKGSCISRSYRSIRIYPAEWARVSNHKYRVRRTALLHDAHMVLRKSADSRCPISIGFEGDVGVGQGPTAHFYTLIADKVKREELHLWRGGTTTIKGNKNKGGKPKDKNDKNKTNIKSKSKAVGDDDDVMVIPTAEGVYPCTDISVRAILGCPVSPQVLPGGGRILTDHGICMNDFAEFDRERAECYYLVGAALGRAFTDEVVFPLDISPALAIFLSHGVPPARVVLSDDNISFADKNIERPVDFMGLSIDDVELMDKSLASSLRSLLSLDAKTLETMDLPFTLPGDDAFELVSGGAKLRVTTNNLSRYFHRAITGLLYESAVFPIRFLAYGFHDVVPCGALATLDPQEMMELLCGSKQCDTQPLWTLSQIKSILVADHGYQNDSPQMTMLQNVLAQRLTPREQRLFLLFCTGCPRLPAGGVGSLGAITVVRRADVAIFGQLFGSGCISTDRGSRPGSSLLRENELTESLTERDWPLPTVNTCFRYLKLPPYPTEEMMYRKLQLSITQGGETFQLS